MSAVERVPALEWEQWSSDSGAMILDVREPSEWDLGCLPGSTRISMGEIVARLGEIDRDQPVLVVCRSGSRSLQVANYLTANGFQAANLEGGLKALGLQD